MEKITLDIYTEQLLKKRTNELRQYIPYDIFIRIEQIINRAIAEHFIFKSQIEELISLLQEYEQNSEAEMQQPQKNSIGIKSSNIVTNNNARIMFHNQTHDFEVVRYRKMLVLILSTMSDTEAKTKINGITI